MKRTNQQNKALHKYFRLLARSLNDAGFDMKRTLREDWEIPWTEEMIKEHIWRPVQKVMTEKMSTTELDTIEVNQIYEVVNRHLSQSTGVHVDFPHEDE